MKLLDNIYLAIEKLITVAILLLIILLIVIYAVKFIIMIGIL
jgi:hypothetical protein